MIGCEKDDICIENLTPNLIITFNDISNPTNRKDVTLLNIWVDGKDTIVSNQTTDSIAIPLNVNDIQTTYNFRSESIIDQITIDYTVDEIYVSRSCGFIANYNSITISNSNLWIQDVQILSQTIENETEAHVQILH